MGSAESAPENMGWRILEVMAESPCSDCHIIPYFEFIVGINGVRLDTSSETFWDIIQSNENHETILTLFNYKTHIKRNISVIPNSEWGGEGLLGLVIVLSDFTKADEQCIRVLKVHPNSPAKRAQLQAQTDYLVGTPVEPFTDFSKFKDIIEEYCNMRLPLWVYNSQTAQIRLIEIVPTPNWRGTGILGCEVGDGYLHHIPSLQETQTRVILRSDMIDRSDPLKPLPQPKGQTQIQAQGQVQQQAQAQLQQVVAAPKQMAPQVPTMANSGMNNTNSNSNINTNSDNNNNSGQVTTDNQIESAGIYEFIQEHKRVLRKDKQMRQNENNPQMKQMGQARQMTRIQEQIGAAPGQMQLNQGQSQQLLGVDGMRGGENIVSPISPKSQSYEMVYGSNMNDVESLASSKAVSGGNIARNQNEYYSSNQENGNQYGDEEYVDNDEYNDQEMTRLQDMDMSQMPQNVQQQYGYNESNYYAQ